MTFLITELGFEAPRIETVARVVSGEEPSLRGDEGSSRGNVRPFSAPNAGHCVEKRPDRQLTKERSLKS